MADLPFDQREGWIWFDGEFIPWQEAKVHIMSHGFHYASAVFEGIRAYNGHIFKLHEHNERLVNSGRVMDFKIPYSVEELDDACRATIEKNGLKNAYLRPLAWRGTEQMGVTAQRSKIHTMIATWEWPSYFSPEAREKGISLITAPWKRPSPECAPVHTKAIGLYMICTLSKHFAENNGYNDALMLDYRGQVAEATGANIFLMKDGEIHTPIADCFLNGITRRTIMEIAESRGYAIHERAIMPEELKDFDEVFLTGTAAEVTAVGKINDLTYEVGPITRQLRSDYEALVNSGADEWMLAG